MQPLLEAITKLSRKAAINKTEGQISTIAGISRKLDRSRINFPILSAYESKPSNRAALIQRSIACGS